MALNAWSKFYYGYEITVNNNMLNFDEGSGELVIELTNGIYAPNDLALELKTQFDAIGTKTYTVEFNRSTRKFTISCDSGTFDLLINTGSQIDVSCWGLIGFTGNDLIGLGSYTSNIESGSEYKVQFMLQDYVSPNEWYEKIDPSINESASGYVEIISYGTVQYCQFNLMFINNYACDGRVIRTSTNGIEKANAFMQFLIKRGHFDFIPDENEPNTYYILQLESTAESQKGVAYKLKEEVDKSLPGYFQTGLLKFRVIS